MNKVWLIWEHYIGMYEDDYSGDNVVRVYASKEAAEAYLADKPRTLKDRRGGLYYTMQDFNVHIDIKSE